MRKKIIILTTLLMAFVLLTGFSCQNKQTAPVPQPTPPTSSEEPQKNKKLDLTNEGLEKIPSYVFSDTALEDLTELNVSHNRIAGAVQAGIRQLQKLKVLNLSNNLMTGVPAEIGQLKNLEILDLSNNQLTGLPYELGNLKNLKTLNISGNNYSKQDLNIIKQSLPSSVKIIEGESQPQTNAEAKVSIENFSFNPETLTIKVGTTVIWTNRDVAPHLITNKPYMMCTYCKYFQSDPLSKGDTFQFTFYTAGSYDYMCGIHPSMKGKIIVE